MIGRDYAYWGALGPKPPTKFEPLIKSGRAEQYQVDDENLKDEFIDWLQGIPDRGFKHEPADWSLDKKLKQLHQ